MSHSERTVRIREWKFLRLQVLEPIVAHKPLVTAGKSGTYLELWINTKRLRTSFYRYVRNENKMDFKSVITLFQISNQPHQNARFSFSPTLSILSGSPAWWAIRNHLHNGLMWDAEKALNPIKLKARAKISWSLASSSVSNSTLGRYIETSFLDAERLEILKLYVNHYDTDRQLNWVQRQFADLNQPVIRVIALIEQKSLLK